MIEVTEITIKIGEKEINLSIDDAKDLRNKLNDIFGNDVIIDGPWYPYQHPPFIPYYTWTSDNIELITTPDGTTFNTEDDITTATGQKITPYTFKELNKKNGEENE